MVLPVRQPVGSMKTIKAEPLANLLPANTCRLASKQIRPLIWRKKPIKTINMPDKKVTGLHELYEKNPIQWSVAKLSPSQPMIPDVWP